MSESHESGSPCGRHDGYRSGRHGQSPIEPRAPDHRKSKRSNFYQKRTFMSPPELVLVRKKEPPRQPGRAPRTPIRQQNQDSPGSRRRTIRSPANGCGGHRASDNTSRTRSTCREMDCFR